MTSPHNLPQETAVSAPKQEHAALYIALIMATAVTIVLITSRILTLYRGESLLLGAIFPVIIVSVWVGVWLIWRGHIIWGTSLFPISFYLTVGIIISQRADIGVFLTITLMSLSIMLFVYTWPRRFLVSGVLVTVFIGVLLTLADLYWRVSRPAISESVQLIVYIGTAMVVSAMVVLIFRQFPNFTIRAKLTITFLAVTLASFTLLAISASFSVRKALIESADKQLLTAASQTAVRFDSFMSNLSSDVRSEAVIMGQAYDWAYYRRLPIEDRSTLGLLGEIRAVDLLKIYRDKDPINIVSYALLDLDGQIMFEYPPRDTNSDESDRSYFKNVIETGFPYLSPVEFSPDDGEAYLYFSALVFDDANERFGVLRGQYKADILHSLIQPSTGLIGRQSFAVIFDENNLHLAHGISAETIYKLTSPLSTNEIAELQANYRLPNLPIDELSVNLPELDQNLNNATPLSPSFTAQEIATGSQTNQVAVVLMREQPWKVAFFQPQDVFLSSIQTQARQSIVTILVITGVVAIIAILVAGFIARPIVLLDTAAAQVAAGDLTIQVEVVSNDEIGTLARTFNLMTTQLRDTVVNLEQRVAGRTRALEISGEISRQLSTILNRQELAAAVVEQVQQAFDYYHAQIYLFDEAGKNLFMTGGTGEAGKMMLAQGHKIAKGQGLVGRASEMNMVMLVSDISEEVGWLPNPLLPDTKSEIAIPIAVGSKVLGVLDVQHNLVHGLDQSDAELLTSIAFQAAIALENARLYERSQEQADQQVAINLIGQRIAQTTTVEEAMQIAVREVGRAVGSPQTAVRLTNRSNAGNGSKLRES